MKLSKSELRRRLASNAALVLEQPCDLTGSPRTNESAQSASDMADELLARLRTLAPDMPLPVRDYPFETFKIDLAWVDYNFCVEVDGGQWQAGGGKHGSKRDYYKTRRIARAGWTLYRFTAGEVRDDPMGVIEEIREALCKS